jgi:hypothetical protein
VRLGDEGRGYGENSDGCEMAWDLRDGGVHQAWNSLADEEEPSDVADLLDSGLQGTTSRRRLVEEGSVPAVACGREEAGRMP